MITSGPAWLSKNRLVVSGLMLGLLFTALFAIFFFIEEGTEGDIQRIAFLFISAAWCAVIALASVGATGIVYLLRRNLSWDHWSRAAAETGWLCSTLTLVTGLMWDRETGRTAWTWEPRLIVAAVMWMMYGGYFLLRSSLTEPHRRARLSAVVGILGLLDVPLAVAATRWFGGLTPLAPESDLRLQLVLLVSVVAFAAFFAFLTMQRRWQLGLEQQIATLEWQVGVTSRLVVGEDARASQY